MAYTRDLYLTSPMMYGSDVSEVQLRLNQLGFNCGTVDGYFGSQTDSAVRSFQSAAGLVVDGIVGIDTWNALFTHTFKRDLYLTSPMMSGVDVRDVQSRLNQLGFNCGTVDGWFGSQTDSAVRSYQSANGLVSDGDVEINTWNSLFGTSSGGGGSLSAFVSAAQSQVGYTETPVNYTKYGQWYGLDGNPWCAMFVSWCANQAGILNTIVPKYASCSAGASWYSNQGRYNTRESGYAPKSGDVIFFNVDGGINHTGIVESYSSGTVNTIEGNSSDAVRRHSYSLSSTYINGYGVD